MQVKVSYTELATIFTAQTFTILVTSPCLTDTLIINSAKFPTPAVTYNIRYPAHVFSWSDTFVTSAVNLPSVCGSYSWTVTKIDGVTVIDPTIFKEDFT